MDSPILISGLGVISPLGHDPATLWHNVIAGRSGIEPLQRIRIDGLRNSRGGEIRDFTWSQFGEEGDADPASCFAFAAASDAAQNARLDATQKSRCGLVFSTNFGGALSWEMWCDMARDNVFDNETYAQFLPQHAVNYTALRWKNSGPRLCLSNACSSGTHALGIAFDWLRLGRCDVVIAGGFDGLGISSLAGLSILRTISPDEIRPFDARRNGTIFGEGAAMIVLETAGSVQKRGVRPLARVLGYGVSNNAHHLTAPDKGGAGLAMAMRKALFHAKTAPDAIGYINAHGTGTQLNDLAETQAIRTVFGSHADHIAVSSTKAATSHMMGAAGAVEALICVQALQHNTLPPNLGLETPGEGCDLDFALAPRNFAGDVVISNSSGIGGNNASLILARV